MKSDVKNQTIKVKGFEIPCILNYHWRTFPQGSGEVDINVDFFQVTRDGINCMELQGISSQDLYDQGYVTQANLQLRGKTRRIAKSNVRNYLKSTISENLGRMNQHGLVKFIR